MLTLAVKLPRTGSEAKCATGDVLGGRTTSMVLHLQWCVERALKEDGAGMFNKPPRQPSLIRALKVVAAELSLAFTVTKMPRSKLSRDKG
jgi:hypothetical protein